MKLPENLDRKKIIIAGSALAAVLVLCVVIGVIRGRGKKTPRRSEYAAKYEGMTELSSEEIEALIRRDEAQDTLSGLGNAESLAGLAADGKWMLDEPEDRGWSLSKAAPFFLRIRFDRNNVVLMENDTALWRRIYEGQYLWNDELIYEYLEQLKEKYDTPHGEVKFTTHDGRVLTFYTENCGWHMNLDQTADALKAVVESGGDVLDPVWDSGLVYSASNGVGNRYVEIDIPAQKVFLYEDGELVVETDCVTGTKGLTDTVPGVFQVMYKASPTVLKDKDIYGNAYEQPVDYWVSFNYSQGLHDAQWRAEFGGDIYESWGSHGCVNLPLDAAAAIYNELYNYFPVVVYDESIEGVNSLPGNGGEDAESDDEGVRATEESAVPEEAATEESGRPAAVVLSAGLPTDAIGG